MNIVFTDVFFRDGVQSFTMKLLFMKLYSNLVDLYMCLWCKARFYDLSVKFFSVGDYLVWYVFVGRILWFVLGILFLMDRVLFQ